LSRNLRFAASNALGFRKAAVIDFAGRILNPMLPSHLPSKTDACVAHRRRHMKLDKLHLILEESPRAAAENMAVDEMLFLTVACPALRVYRWIRPSVSFGYFTPWAEVSSRFAGRDLIRRWTGGGIVEHGRDFTYSLVCPNEKSLPPTIDFYLYVHLAIANILRKSGYPVEIADAADPIQSAACFAKAV
jgi:lipoyl(octanoyl) transferase